MEDVLSMSVEELSVWLEDQGIPSEFSEKFEGDSIYIRTANSDYLL